MQLLTETQETAESPPLGTTGAGIVSVVQLAAAATSTPTTPTATITPATNPPTKSARATDPRREHCAIDATGRGARRQIRSSNDPASLRTRRSTWARHYLSDLHRDDVIARFGIRPNNMTLTLNVFTTSGSEFSPVSPRPPPHRRRR